MKRLCSGLLALSLVFTLAACGTQGSTMKDGAPSTKEKTMTDKIKDDKMEDKKKLKDAEMEDEKMMAADFELQDLDGNTVKLSDFSEKNVYIKYWASWCPICLDGLADLNTFIGDNPDITVLTIVSPDAKGEKNAADFKEWFAGVENTANITVLLDEKGTYTTAAGVRGYPTSEWIDMDGRILSIAPGHADNEQIKAGFADMS